MIRKLFVLLAVLLPVLMTKAQDVRSQPPIIALRENKLYAISPVDGKAKVLVTTEAEETISTLTPNLLTPDGKWLTYVIEKWNDGRFSSQLFLLHVEDGKVETIEAKGGVFDRPIPSANIITMNAPTWSYDGTRLYYVRTEINTQPRDKVVLEQLAYYDMTTHKHTLVTRLDPDKILLGLQPVRNGLVVQMFRLDGNVADVTLFGTNNILLKHMDVVASLPEIVSYEGQTYYADLDGNGAITSLTDAETGDQQDMTGPYYPAVFSSQAADTSLRIFPYFGDSSTTFNVYAADTRYLKELRGNQGFRYAIAPDGQSLAFIQYGDSGFGHIQIMDHSGAIRDLAFDAQLIIWGSTETQVYQPLG